jgi:hypothetical protein
VVEYWITDVKIDNNKLKEVRALLRTIEGLSNPVRYTKEDIVKSIEKNDNSWYTAVLEDTTPTRNIWKRRTKIHVVDVNGEKFIRSDKNKTKEDNLGNLPNIKE